MTKFFERLQFGAVIAGFIAMLPEFYHIYIEKSKATDALSLWTGVIFIFESLLRLPNIGKGLFAALKEKNSEKIKQLGLSAAGVFGMCLSFYILTVCQALLDTANTTTTAHDKHLAKIFSIVYGILIAGMIVFYTQGIAKARKTVQ